MKVILYAVVIVGLSINLSGSDLVSVSRWTNSGGGTFIHRDGQVGKEWYSSRGFINQRHLYYAYNKKPNHDESLAVRSYRWKSKTVKGNEDWVAAMDGAVPDSWWTSRGYTDKSFEGWVFKSKPENPPQGYQPVKVNRWDDRKGNWVTAPEGSKEERELIAINATNKSFLYWGLKLVHPYASQSSEGDRKSNRLGSLKINEKELAEIGNKLKKIGKRPVALLVDGFNSNYMHGAHTVIDALKLLDCEFVAKSVRVNDKYKDNLIGRNYTVPYHAIYDDHEVSWVEPWKLSDHHFITQGERYFSRIDKGRPLIIIGHSFGGDSVLKLARKLNEVGRSITFLGLLDPVATGGVRNEGWAVNIKAWQDGIVNQEVTPNVEYLYNRWQTLDHFFPIDADRSGKIKPSKNFARIKDEKQHNRVSHPDYAKFGIDVIHDNYPIDKDIQMEIIHAVKKQLLEITNRKPFETREQFYRDKGNGFIISGHIDVKQVKASVLRLSVDGVVESRNIILGWKADFSVNITAKTDKGLVSRSFSDVRGVNPNSKRPFKFYKDLDFGRDVIGVESIKFNVK